MSRTTRAVALLAAVALLLAGCGGAGSSGLASSGSSSAGSLGHPSSSAARPATSAAPSPTAATVPAAAVRRADARIDGLTGDLGRGGVSIAATDETDGATFSFGAQRGMRCGSIAKLAILETLLLIHQRSGHALSQELSEDTQELATRMIENSDNDAANELWEDIGEGRGLDRAAGTLGLRHTVPGAGIYWGYTLTDAGDFVALLRNLVRTGPLDTVSQHYVLHLMAHVEDDQRWGVGVATDRGTSFVNKNGWLPVSVDDGRWLVNSVGIVTVRGHRVLMAVLTQHGASFDGGIDLVQQLARTTAKALAAA